MISPVIKPKVCKKALQIRDEMKKITIFYNFFWTTTFALIYTSFRVKYNCSTLFQQKECAWQRRA